MADMKEVKMENFYEKMHLDKVESDNFEPPHNDVGPDDDDWWQDEPYGEEQAIVDAKEGKDNTDWTEVLRRRDELGLTDEDL